MKRTGILGMILGMVLLATATRGALANEGVIELGAVEQMGARCFALSVFNEGRYEINSTCRGLVVPYNAELTRYIMWAVEPDGKVYRVGEIRNGKISQIVSDRFDSLMVTVEAGTQPRKPNEKIILRGEVKSIAFLGETTAFVSPSPTPAQKVVVNSVTEEKNEPGSLTKILRTVGRIVGIGFLVLLVGVVLMTVITRRKEKI